MDSVVSVWVPSDWAEALRQYAEEHGRSVSDVVRGALTEFLERMRGVEGEGPLVETYAWVPEPWRDALRRLSKRLGMSMSELVRYAVRDLLTKHLAEKPRSRRRVFYQFRVDGQYVYVQRDKDLPQRLVAVYGNGFAVLKRGFGVPQRPEVAYVFETPPPPGEIIELRKPPRRNTTFMGRIFWLIAQRGCATAPELYREVGGMRYSTFRTISEVAKRFNMYTVGGYVKILCRTPADLERARFAVGRNGRTLYVSAPALVERLLLPRLGKDVIKIKSGHVHELFPVELSRHEKRYVTTLALTVLGHVLEQRGYRTYRKKGYLLAERV